MDPENDAQYNNWEEPVINWARSTISNFDLEFNKPISDKAELLGGNQGLFINLISPNNGSFLQNPLILSVDTKSDLNIKKLEIYFNNSLIDSVFNISGNYSYRKTLQVTNTESQNLLRIVAVDESNNKAEKEIIIYN